MIKYFKYFNGEGYAKVYLHEKDNDTLGSNYFM